MKTENKETQVQWKAWSYAQYVGETERERERERERKKNTENNIPKNSNSMLNEHVCVFNAHVLYKSLQGLKKVLSYFNAL